ncbi:MAG: hypothetical protein QXL10_00700 [Candidatus Bathyarchaeia archaeon]
MSKSDKMFTNIVLYIPKNLALDFFRESGDLPVNSFPAITKLAHIIGKMLGENDSEQPKVTLETFVRRKLRKKQL